MHPKLHLRALSDLWGRYDSKSENKAAFQLVTLDLDKSFSLIPVMTTFCSKHVCPGNE